MNDTEISQVIPQILNKKKNKKHSQAMKYARSPGIQDWKLEKITRPYVHARMCAKLIQLCLTLWLCVACQAPLCMGFPRHEYWSGLSCPPPGDLLNPGTELQFLMSPALAGGFFTTSAAWEAMIMKFSQSRDWSPQELRSYCTGNDNWNGLKTELNKVWQNINVRNQIGEHGNVLILSSFMPDSQ